MLNVDDSVPVQIILLKCRITVCRANGNIYMEGTCIVRGCRKCVCSNGAFSCDISKCRKQPRIIDEERTSISITFRHTGDKNKTKEVKEEVNVPTDIEINDPGRTNENYQTDKPEHEDNTTQIDDIENKNIDAINVTKEENKDKQEKADISRPGKCPTVDQIEYKVKLASRNVTGCNKTCDTDSSCPDDLKCCNNGCGNECLTPLTKGSYINTFTLILSNNKTHK